MMKLQILCKLLIQLQKDIVDFIFLIMFLWAVFSLFFSSFLFFFPHRKLQPTPPKQLQNFSAENVNNINMDQEECTLSAVGQQLQTTAMHFPPAQNPQNKQVLMLSSISLLLFNKMLFGVSLLACEGWKHWLRSLLSGLLCLQPFKIIFFCCYTHFLQAFVQSQLHLNRFIKMIFSILHPYQK